MRKGGKNKFAVTAAVHHGAVLSFCIYLHE